MLQRQGDDADRADKKEQPHHRRDGGAGTDIAEVAECRHVDEYEIDNQRCRSPQPGEAMSQNERCQHPGVEQVTGKHRGLHRVRELSGQEKQGADKRDDQVNIGEQRQHAVPVLGARKTFEPPLPINGQLFDLLNTGEQVHGNALWWCLCINRISSGRRSKPSLTKIRSL